MSSYQLATATRIWKNDDTSVEYQAPTTFLWSMVTCLEAANHDAQRWQDSTPKTVFTLSDESMFYVLGRFDKWVDKWNRYLLQVERRSLLFEN